MLKRMYLSPIRSILDNFAPKLVLGVLLAPFMNWLPPAAEGAFFTIPPGLLMIVLGLWLLDFASGITKVLRDDDVTGIKSYRLRQTVIKLIEYGIFILALDLFSSTADYAGVVGVALEQIDDVGCIILAGTEFKSIDENLRWNLLAKMRGYIAFNGLLGSEKQKEEQERRTEKEQAATSS